MNSTFTRRSFLKHTAFAAGAFSTTPLFGPNLLATDEPAKKLNCVQVGCGGRGMNHLEWLIGQANENVMAIVDPDEKAHAKVKRYLKEHDRDPEKTQTFTDYRRMFDKIGKDVDAVFIATPNHHHAPAAMLAMNLNKAVYCEKPLTHDIAEARKMREMALKY